MTSKSLNGWGYANSSVDPLAAYVKTGVGVIDVLPLKPRNL